MLSPKITFCGGAGGVTGACYLLELESKNILVDCGLFQGGRFAEEENRKPFPFNPSKIDTVFITHAHADHIGRLPKLYKDGFRGTIIATPPTKDLADVMLRDAYHVMRHELEYQKGELLFSEHDLVGVLELFKAHSYDTPLPFAPDCTATLRDSAHVLGSAMIEMSCDDTKIVFTGDIGNTPSPLLRSIYPIEHTDYMVMESVYGDRIHESHTERKTILERTIEDVYSNGGTIIIPSFALERTQEILSELDELVQHNRIPRIPIFLDSPLAINATKVYEKYVSYFNESAKEELQHDGNLFNFPGLHLTPSREESRAINDVKGPKIIMAGNPHGYGSRIGYHLMRYLSDPNSAVVFVGYARVSSLGRMLVDGARDVRIMDKHIPVRAQIRNIAGYSAHADQNQLKEFVRRFHKPIKHVFVTMGEPASSDALRRVIRDELGIQASAPLLGDVVPLNEPI